MSSISIDLPQWLDSYAARAGEVFATLEDRMRLAVELARRNSETLDAGPFGAAIFEIESGRLVAVGVNRVMPAQSSILHAEVVAIFQAQRRLGTHDLGAPGLPSHELVTSVEPCAMCFGAVPWCGVRRLVCGARDEDAREIGFDEGPKLPDWPTALASRGIAVLRDILRPDAAAVLRSYRDRGGVIYNGRGEDG